MSQKRKTGRKPAWFRDWCDEAINSEAFLNKLKDALENKKFSVWFPVFKELQVIAHGKPAQPIVGKDGDDLSITVKTVQYGNNDPS